MSVTFSITSSDGKVGQSPSGVFTSTSSKPSDNITIIKGTSDYDPVNSGLPGFYSKPQAVNLPIWFIEENGEPATVQLNNGQSANPGNGLIKLKGRTIYGYIVTHGTRPNPLITSSDQEEACIINFITNPDYKLDTPTYNGWGLKDVNILASSDVLHSYKISKGLNVIATGLPDTFEYIPITWYFDDASNASFCVVFLTLSGGSLAVGSMIISGVSSQETLTSQNIEFISPRAITILNSDIIIPSLEDRVSQLEQQVADFPSDIDTPFALAVDKVSKIFVSR